MPDDDEYKYMLELEGNVDRLTRDLAEARAEAVSLRSHNAGLVKIEAQKDAEIERLRAAIDFWAMATYPENRPDPHDIEGRCRVQAARDLAETTLYEIYRARLGAEQ